MNVIIMAVLLLRSQMRSISMFMLGVILGLFLYSFVSLFVYQALGEGIIMLKSSKSAVGPMLDDVENDIGNNTVNNFRKKPMNVPKYVPKDTLLANNNIPVPRCTPKERIELLKTECGNKTNLTLDQLGRKERYRALRNIFVDEKHKILACIPPKSGCSTWKTILANNTFDDPLPEGFKTHSLHFGALQSKFHIYRLSEYNATLQEHMLKSDEYFRFMIARHPFERLYSAYVNKLVSGTDLAQLRYWGKIILDKLHPELPETVRNAGKGVTFEEFVHFLKEPNNYKPNLHWEPIVNLCQPCLVNYDYIVKTETMDEDNEPIIIQQLLPHRRGLHTTDNVVVGGPQETSLTQQGRKMEEYQHLSEEELRFLENRFKEDLQYFGYTWRIEKNNTKTGSLFSSCTHGATDKACC